MNNQYTDFEELRPTGEASHIPDEKLSEGCDVDPRRQRVAPSTDGYPDQPAGADGEYQYCGMSIPAGQMKCRFCLTDHLGDESASTDGTADATLLGIVHMIVESTTFYGAVAKGGAAAKLLTSNETEPVVDDAGDEAWWCQRWSSPRRPTSGRRPVSRRRYRPGISSSARMRASN